MEGKSADRKHQILLSKNKVTSPYSRYSFRGWGCSQVPGSSSCKVVLFLAFLNMRLQELADKGYRYTGMVSGTVVLEKNKVALKS